MIRRLAVSALLAFGAALPATGLTLSLPERAQMTADEDVGLVATGLPAGVWQDGDLPELEVEGRETRQAWVLRGGTVTPAQLMLPLREALEEQGHSVVFECESRECGGFDFRRALDLIPAPDMFVDLGSFRYLLATQGGEDGQRAVAIVTSSSPGAGHIHITQIEPEEAEATPVTVVVPTTPEGSTGPLAERLRSDGRAVLEGLAFQSGSAELSDENYQGLSDLATFLIETPEARVVLVGHTDATGALDRNIELSQRRADAVRDQLIGEYGVNAEQVSARGIGYLAPRATNVDEAGRERNRRVEIVLLAPG